MARKSRNRWILLVVMAMVLATVGVVYAHWTSSLRVDVNVNTGNVAMGWYDVFTNDDGVNNIGEEGYWQELWDEWWGPGSSADPANPSGDDRYDKDVAACFGGGGGEHAWFQVHNGYPSYYCAMFASAMNEGSVPVKATSISLTMGGEFCFFPGFDAYHWVGDDSGEWLDDPTDDDGYEGYDEYPFVFDVGTDFWISYSDQGPFIETPGGPVYQECFFEERDDIVYMPGDVEGNFAIGYYDDSGAFVAELTGDIAMGIRCGTQVDPNEAYDTAGWIHVEQEARQNYDYSWSLVQNFVNWNEFDYFLCTPGTIAADSDGNPIGIVDHSMPKGYDPF